MAISVSSTTVGFSASDAESGMLECVIYRCKQLFRADYKFYLGLGGVHNPGVATGIAQLYMSAIGGRIETPTTDQELEPELIDYLIEGNGKSAPPRSVLVLGDSGTGKTSLALTLAQTIWAQKPSKNRTLPLYINLPDLVALNPDLDKILETYLRSRDVSPRHLTDYIRLLKTQNLVIILDSYDEISATLSRGGEGEGTSNLWDTNGWGDNIPGSIRMVTFSRPAVLPTLLRKRRAMFDGIVKYDFCEQSKRGFQEFYLQKYTEGQFETYVHSFVHFVRCNSAADSSHSDSDGGLWWSSVWETFTELDWTDDPVKEYKAWFTKLPDLRNLAALTPFMLSMIMRALPGLVLRYKNQSDDDQLRRVCSTKTGVFDAVTDQWFEYQAKRDRNKFEVKGQEERKSSRMIDLASLVGYYRAYAQNLAQFQFDSRTGFLKEGQLSDEDTLSQDLAEPSQNLELLSLYLNDPLHSNLFPMSPFSTTRARADKDKDKDKDKDEDESAVVEEERKRLNLKLLRDGCLIESSGSVRFRFSHRSLLEYFAARHSFDTLQSVFDYYVDGVVGTVSGKAGQSSLDRQLIKEREVLVQLAERVRLSSHFRELLQSIVFQSATLATIAKLASNAITILNFAGFSFSGQDLRHINVAGANLCGAVLGAADLRGACLRNVNLQYAHLCSTRLDGANLLEADVGTRREVKMRAVVNDVLTYTDHESGGHNLAWVSTQDGILSIWNLDSMIKLTTVVFCSGTKCPSVTSRRLHSSGEKHDPIRLSRLSVDKFIAYSECSWVDGVQVRNLQSGYGVAGWPKMPVEVQLEEGLHDLEMRFNCGRVKATCSTAPSPDDSDVILLWDSQVTKGTVLQFFRRGTVGMPPSPLSPYPPVPMHILPYCVIAARFHPTYPSLLLFSFIGPGHNDLLHLYRVGEWATPLATLTFLWPNFEFHPDGQSLVLASRDSHLLSVYSVAIATVQGTTAETEGDKVGTAAFVHVRDVNVGPGDTEFMFSSDGAFLLSWTNEFVSVWVVPDYKCVQYLSLLEGSRAVTRLSGDASLLIRSFSVSDDGGGLSVYELRREGVVVPPPPPHVPSFLLGSTVNYELQVFVGPGSWVLVAFWSPHSTRFVSFDSNWFHKFTTAPVDLVEAGVGNSILAWTQLRSFRPTEQTCPPGVPGDDKTVMLLVVGSVALGLLRVQFTGSGVGTVVIEDVHVAEGYGPFTNCNRPSHSVVRVTGGRGEDGLIVLASPPGHRFFVQRFWVTKGTAGEWRLCLSPCRGISISNTENDFFATLSDITHLELSFPTEGEVVKGDMGEDVCRPAYIVVKADEVMSDTTLLYRVDSPHEEGRTRTPMSAWAPTVRKVGEALCSNPLGRGSHDVDPFLRVRTVLGGTNSPEDNDKPNKHDVIGYEFVETGGSDSSGRLPSFALISNLEADNILEAYQPEFSLLAVSHTSRPRSTVIRVYDTKIGAGPVRSGLLKWRKGKDPPRLLRPKPTIRVWFSVQSLVFQTRDKEDDNKLNKCVAHLLVAGSRNNVMCIQIGIGRDDEWRILWSLEHCFHLVIDSSTRITRALMQKDTAGRFGARVAAHAPETRPEHFRFIPFCSLISEVVGSATATGLVMRPKVSVPRRRFLISPDSWVLSVVIEKAPGRWGVYWNPLLWFDLVHAFLILEGLWPGRGPRQFAIRAELVNIAGTDEAVVRTERLDDLDRLHRDMSNYKAQQWNITKEQGLKLLQNIQIDHQRYLKFSKLQSNCAKWCKDQLKGIGIETRGAWYNFVLVTPGQMLT